MAPTLPSSQEKRKRNVLTLPKKIELVKRREKGESREKLMAEYGVGSSRTSCYLSWLVLRARREKFRRGKLLKGLRCRI